MNSFFRKNIPLACSLAILLSLNGCGQKASEPATTPTLEPIVLPTATVAQEVEVTNPNMDVETLTVVMTAGDLYTLNHYPNLKSVDLTGSTCYGAILDHMSKHPELDVTFTVDLGGTQVSVKDTSATLASGAFDYDMLLENLQYLPNLTTLVMPDFTLTPDQLNGLMTAYPELVLEYSVSILGNAITPETTELDLSGLGSGQVEDACAKLSLMPNLAKVSLSSSLSKEDVDKLQTAAPHIVFDYSFSLSGKTISTADEEVIYKNQDIGNSGEPELREALKIMDKCKRFVLDNCGFSNETLAKIREDFRGGPKVVWRVYFGVDGRYNTVTDDDTIRAVYNVTDDTCGPMKYLEDVKYMDIGHNEFLSDLSFVGYMPNLEVLIASESAVKELTGFDNCKKLTWLELAYCYKLENIDALSGCDGLKYLNISYSKVKSFEPLDNLALERFVYLKPKASTKEQNTFTTIHPKGECITVFYGYSMPYSYGWRYDDNGKTMFWYYKDVIRKVFNYDQADAILKAQEDAK
ncbi:MAG: hypothetical protein IKA16_02570 [Oscillospiraceae bacterium]|nr:hypothetical protein [Oscillospiraceae bacterium]